MAPDPLAKERTIRVDGGRSRPNPDSEVVDVDAANHGNRKIGTSSWGSGARGTFITVIALS
jgi:hypothetical protein